MRKLNRRTLREQGFEEKSIFQFLRKRVTPMHKLGRPKNYGLAPASKRLLNWLKRHGENGRWIGRQSEIARALRIHPRTVRKAVVDLEKHGYVHRIHEPGIKYGIELTSWVSQAGKRPKNNQTGPEHGPENTRENELKKQVKSTEVVPIFTQASERPKNETAGPIAELKYSPTFPLQPQYPQQPSLTREKAEALLRGWLQKNRPHLSFGTSMQSLKLSWMTGQEPAKSFPPIVKRAAELLWGKFGHVI